METKTVMTTDGVISGIVEDRLALLERRATQDRQVIRGMLVLLEKLDPQAHGGIKAMRDRLDR